jgi:1-acyl-sn-glycerol-3-phosphate acyltransferase
MSYPVLSWLIKAWGVIPIDRSGADRHALMQAIAMLQNGHCVLVAPEGTRHPSMQTVREGVAYLATKTNAVIVPTAVEGTDKFGGNLRRLRRTEVWVTYGPAFRFDFGSDSRPGREDMYQMSTEAAYQIARLLPESRRGVYADMGKLTTDTLRFIET